MRSVPLRRLTATVPSARWLLPHPLDASHGAAARPPWPSSAATGALGPVRLCSAAQCKGTAAKRAAAIMEAEPVTKKTPAILAIFKSNQCPECMPEFELGHQAAPGFLPKYREFPGASVNARTPLAEVPASSIIAAHGSNLATAIQVLRNANGQIVPYNHLKHIGIQQRSGEGLIEQGSPQPGPPSVSGARIHYRSRACLLSGLEQARRYGQIEAGHGDHYYGTPQRPAGLSEAQNIPVVMVGEPVDPQGYGATINANIYFKIPQASIDTMPEGHPWHGKTTEQIAEEMAFQLQAERINVRALLVWDPEGNGRDALYRDIVRQLVKLIEAEQNLNYGDLAVGLMAEDGAAWEEIVQERATTDKEPNADIKATLLRASAAMP